MIGPALSNVEGRGQPIVPEDSTTRPNQGLGEETNGAAAVIEASNVVVEYGSGSKRLRVISNLSLAVRRSEFVSIIGPSGCGKTTLLRTLAGLSRPTSGSVGVDGRPVNGPAPNLAFVFQDYTRSLLPWLNVERNVTFPLRARGVSKTERTELGREALSNVGLSGFENHFPWQLSGGMQQRVAIARALAYQPAVMLMDEPFASLDAQVRADLEDLVLRIQSATSLTVLFVTHDIDEAIYVGNRVIVLSGRPAEVRESLDVPLGHPRDQLVTRSDPLFLDLRAKIMKMIHRDARP